jgi:chromosome transmission fidelity protein 8
VLRHFNDIFYDSIRKRLVSFRLRPLIKMASTTKLHPTPLQNPAKASNPLPQILQTPWGLALLELQGTINLPQGEETSSGFQIGRIDFPDYDADAEGSAWMKSVQMYIGQHQRLTGEIKKLPKAMAIVRRRESPAHTHDADAMEEVESSDLEVVAVVKHKLMFSTRPEPVGAVNAS